MPSRSRDIWTTVSLALSGLLDTRSRPADIPIGAFRWKQNLRISPEAKLSRRPGHARFYSDAASYTNHDYHHQNRSVREPVTFQFESTSSDGTRRYLLGTQSSISLLNDATGLYTDLFTGKGAEGSRWKAAELKDYVVFTNNVDNVCTYYYGTNTAASTIPQLAITLNVSRAKVVVEFQGFIIVMNVVQDGVLASNRIIWSDLNSPLGFDPAASVNSLAGTQDLDPGDEILAAAPMGGRLYIYTRRAIWWMAPSGDQTTVFNFARPYTEPKNQTGCLAFPNTLVSTGTEHRYVGRDGIYKFTPYIPAPERDDWLHRATGVMYTQTDTMLDTNYCESPVAEYVPDARELWISWPSRDAGGVNNWTLVANILLQTADVVDTGYTSFVNFRRTPASSQACNELQDLLGASGTDWCIKSIGNVFYRETASSITPDDPTTDLPLIATYTQDGYNSVMRGAIPLGYGDRDKIVRQVLLDHDSAAQDTPCIARVRIGNARSIVDPNSADNYCSPQWHDLGDKELTCPNPTAIATLTANGQRPDKATVWPAYEQGHFLWFELTILNANDTAGVGGDTAFQRIDFDCSGLPKPAL